MNTINPMAGKISKSREVLGCRKPLRLEATHLARRSRTTLSRFAANDPAHRRITTQAFSVVYVLISRETSEQGLAKHSNQSMSPFFPVRASARLSPAIALRPHVIVALIPISGYYEWQDTLGDKQPWYFTPRDGQHYSDLTQSAVILRQGVNRATFSPEV
jgi:hypothetical protein